MSERPLIDGQLLSPPASGGTVQLVQGAKARRR
jgi:hypothetical protein